MTSANETSTKSGQGATRPCVFLVEDDGAVLRVVAEGLRLEGFEVLEASGAREALVIAERREGPIDLLLTDVVMPHMSGIELSRRLAASRPSLLTLFISGYAETEIEERCGFDPILHYVQKPFTLDALQAEIRKLLKGKRARE